MATRLKIETLDSRILLAGDGFAACEPDVVDSPPAQMANDVPVEPQFLIKHPPRLQPGNMPLVGTPAYDETDQVDIIWQTMKAGEGSQDSFAVDYRLAGTQDWIGVEEFNEVIDTEVARLMHSVTIRGLAWNTDYEYRVQHLRADDIVQTFQNQFRTRLVSGDPRAFSFGAYGDAVDRSKIENFNSVQREIIRQDLDFGVLLGDNFYTWGSHSDADGRFDPSFSPEAVEWTSKKVDYFGIGNHDYILNRGKASRDLFAVPVPVEGVNAPVGLPEGEFAEHSFSFDYGDTHFVTFDTNPSEFDGPLAEREVRLDALIEYAAADLEASDAHWKIVYGHHPFIGTEKRQSPDALYFQKMVTRLNEAGADLVMLAHSHSFSWTYPMTGFEDVDNDGRIGFDEVSFIQDEDRSYEKGAGVIQLVAGIGGGPLRSDPYVEPMFAAAYSLAESTGPIEHGFARVDVTPRALTVSYVSAATGNIVGDDNGNGIQDPNETYFGRFSVVDSEVPDPDLNDDGLLDELDIDAISAAIRNDDQDSKFDLNEDQSVGKADLQFLLDTYFRVAPGDANLDGQFDSADLVAIFQAGEFEDESPINSRWTSGDWDGDGDFTTKDLVAAFQAGVYIA